MATKKQERHNLKWLMSLTIKEKLMAGDDETEVKFYVQRVEASPTGKVLLLNEFLEDLGMHESEEVATKGLVACGDWYTDIGGYQMREYKRV